MTELMIGRNEAGQRLDKYLRKYMPKAPDGFLYRMLRKKNITLNGHKAAGRELLQEDDLVKLYLADATIEKFRGSLRGGSYSEPLHFDYETFRSRILYEDRDVLFYNKEPGLLVQEASEKGTRNAPYGRTGGDPDVSLEAPLTDLLLQYFLEEGRYKPSDYETFHPAPANRLDRNTSGIVLCGASLAGLQELSELLRGRMLHKYYLVLVCGRMREVGVHTGWVTRNGYNRTSEVSKVRTEGSTKIETDFQVLEAGEHFSLVKAELLTGKTHQIRAHLKSLGHPPAGDPKYGIPEANSYLSGKYQIRRQLLHAHEMVFPKDCGSLIRLSGKTFEAPLPDDFKAVLAGELGWYNMISDSF